MKAAVCVDYGSGKKIFHAPKGGQSDIRDVVCRGKVGGDDEGGQQKRERGLRPTAYRWSSLLGMLTAKSSLR